MTCTRVHTDVLHRVIFRILRADDSRPEPSRVHVDQWEVGSDEQTLNAQNRNSVVPLLSEDLTQEQHQVPRKTTFLRRVVDGFRAVLPQKGEPCVVLAMVRSATC